MRNFFKYFIFIISLYTNSVYSQNLNHYNIDVKLNSAEKTLEINQIMKFKNTFNTPLKEIFLEDWANSYIDNNTNLAKRISDEYSRSFSFAQKKQRGSTFIKEVKSLRIKDWNRSKNASDIIQLNLKEPLLNNESVELEIRYTINLRDSIFTGYGYDRNNIYLTNWLIVFSNIYNSEWLNQSNLNLDDQSLRKSSYKLKISFDNSLLLFLIFIFLIIYS